MEQELLTLPEHLSSPPIFREIRVARSVVSYVNGFFLQAPKTLN